jgi:hypothetical protein
VNAKPTRCPWCLNSDIAFMAKCNECATQFCDECALEAASRAGNLETETATAAIFQPTCPKCLATNVEL